MRGYAITGLNAAGNEVVFTNRRNQQDAYAIAAELVEEMNDPTSELVEVYIWPGEYTQSWGVTPEYNDPLAAWRLGSTEIAPGSPLDAEAQRDGLIGG